MDRDSNSIQALCRSGSGFYGNPSTDGLCSLCYGEALKRKQQPPQEAATYQSPVCVIHRSVPTIPVIASQPQDLKDCQGGEGSVHGTNKEIDTEGKDEKDKSKKRNQCAICSKKVGYTGTECRCGGLYCAFHRYSDKHDCTFNYRELGAQEIRRKNPRAVGKKIHKI